MNFKIVNIEKEHKGDIFKLIEEINSEDKLKYSLTEEWLDYIIKNARDGIFLGFFEEELAGMGTSIINPVYNDQGTLNIVVAPKYRNKGLGEILYSYIYNWTEKNGVKIVECFVKKRLTPGVSFAEKRNFKTSMFSWEMELEIDNLELDLKEFKNLNFRQGNKSDGLKYKRIILDAFGDDLGEEEIIQTLEDPSILIYFLERENEIIGSATVQLRDELKLGYIFDIAILEEYRGQGFGEHLIKSCIMDLKEKNIKILSLSVVGDNKGALNLYEKIGFKEVDIDLIMTKIIN